MQIPAGEHVRAQEPSRTEGSLPSDIFYIRQMI